MNDISGPGTGLDMLLLVADSTTANAGCIPDHQLFSTFEAALGTVPENGAQRKGSAVDDLTLPECDPGPQRDKSRDLEQSPVCTLPLPWSNVASTPVTPEPSLNVRQKHDADDVCFAAFEFVEQSLPGESLEGPSASATPPQRPTAVDRLDSNRDRVASGTHPPSTPRDASDSPLVTRSDIRQRAEIELAGAPSVTTLFVELTDRTDSDSSHPLIVQQLRDGIIKSIKPHVVVRVQRSPADGQTQGRVKRTPEVADKSDRNSSAFGFDSPSEASATETFVQELEALHVTAPTLIDELNADAGRFDPHQDEVTVELNIPDWGVLEIEVTRSGDETEVSLLADPALNLLIRDHLHELSDALSASGIELTGLDIRQHDREHHDTSGHEPILEAAVIDGGNVETSTHMASRTGLSRYRQMSITA
jgi:hypothetical protein